MNNKSHSTASGSNQVSPIALALGATGTACLAKGVSEFVKAKNGGKPNRSLSSITSDFNIDIDKIQIFLEKYNYSISDTNSLTNEEIIMIFEIISNESELSEETLQSPIYQETIKSLSKLRYANRDVLLVHWDEEDYYVTEITRGTKITTDYITATCSNRAEYYSSYESAYTRAVEKQREINQYYSCNIIEYIQP